MINRLMKYTAVAALATGMALAQAAGSNPQTQAPEAHAGQRGFMRRHMERIAAALNLSDSQKQQQRAIFRQARQSAQPVREQLRKNREALTAAAKANQSEAEIQKLSAEQGRLVGQLVAIRTEASAKFYQMLTPEQRVKADQMHAQFKQRRHAAERNNA